MLARAIADVFKGRLKLKVFQQKSIDMRILEHESKALCMKIKNDGHYKPIALEKKLLLHS